MCSFFIIIIITTNAIKTRNPKCWSQKLPAPTSSSSLASSLAHLFSRFLARKKYNKMSQFVFLFLFFNNYCCWNKDKKTKIRIKQNKTNDKTSENLRKSSLLACTQPARALVIIVLSPDGATDAARSHASVVAECVCIPLLMLLLRCVCSLG